MKIRLNYIKESPTNSFFFYLQSLRLLQSNGLLDIHTMNASKQRYDFEHKRYIGT